MRFICFAWLKQPVKKMGGTSVKKCVATVPRMNLRVTNGKYICIELLVKTKCKSLCKQDG